MIDYSFDDVVDLVPLAVVQQLIDFFVDIGVLGPVAWVW